LVEATGDVTREVAADIVDEYKQWLIQTIEQRKKADKETVRYFRKLRQKMERITTGLRDLS
jgi:hypothetical protein